MLAIDAPRGKVYVILRGEILQRVQRHGTSKLLINRHLPVDLGDAP